MSDRRQLPEAVQLKLNQELLESYGPNVTLQSLEPLNNRSLKLVLSYSKAFNIIDDESKVIYVRDVRFPNIYACDIREGSSLKIPVAELNAHIAAEYKGLRNQLAHFVLEDKEVLSDLVRRVHRFSSFLNKFDTLLNYLIVDDMIPRQVLSEFIEEDPKYQKYIDLLSSMNFARVTNEGLMATNRLRLLFKERENARTVVDDVLCQIVKAHFDYVVHELKMYNLQSYVNILACFVFFSKYLRMETVAITMDRLYNTYLSLFKKVDLLGFRNKILALTSAGILSKRGNRVSMAKPIAV